MFRVSMSRWYSIFVLEFVACHFSESKKDIIWYWSRDAMFGVSTKRIEKSILFFRPHGLPYEIEDKADKSEASDYLGACSVGVVP